MGHFPGLFGGPGEDLPDGFGGMGEPVEFPPLDLPPCPPPSVDHIPRPLSPTKLTPMVHSPLRYQSDVELEALRKKLANAPRPLKKRSSITEPEGPSGPNIQKLLYQRFNTLAGGMEAGGVGVGVGPTPAGVPPFYQPGAVGAGVMGQGDADNGNPPSEVPAAGGMAATVPEGTAGETITVTPAALTLPQGDANDNQPAVGNVLPPTGQVQVQPVPAPSEEDNTNNNTQVPITTTLPSPVVEATSPEEAATSPSATTVSVRSALSLTAHKQHDTPTFSVECRIVMHMHTHTPSCIHLIELQFTLFHLLVTLAHCAQTIKCTTIQTIHPALLNVQHWSWIFGKLPSAIPPC